jgi:hypothetical protein
MKDQSPLARYHERYIKIKEELKINSNLDNLLNLIETNPAGLNNYFMAAMGMSTLIVRLGAVIQLCRKLHDGNTENDALFMKQVIDNLRETLPSDTNWRELWEASMKSGSEWEKPSIQPKNGDSLLRRFVTFRNKFAHQSIKIIPADINQLSKSISMFDEMVELIILFKDSSIEEREGKYCFIQGNEILQLHPFIQKGENDGLPYLFQGMDKKEQKAKLINTHLGNETSQASALHLEPLFDPLRQAIRGGAGQVFDHSERLAYYRECFVGRERERNLILEWCKTQDEQNILPVYSNAGMGKGALIADVIYELQKEKIPVLFHFCGAGIQNSLHATLYHFILQGKKNQWWKTEDEEIIKKLDRLPSKYIDLIHFFQKLVSENFKSSRSNTSGNMVILIDGLDEAAVANSTLHILDWFYTYNEKEEAENDWRSPSNIRWIFTYRKTEGQKGYQFPLEKEGAKIEELQPLLGLSESAVDAALSKFIVSEDFKKEVLKKGAIV